MLGVILYLFGKLAAFEKVSKLLGVLLVNIGILNILNFVKNKRRAILLKLCNTCEQCAEKGIFAKIICSNCNSNI